MPEAAATWSDRGVASRLAETRFADVRWFESIDSTNRYVLDLALEGAPEGVVAVADEQTAGRGRLDRRWEAPAGAALLVSVLLRPSLPSELRHLVTLAGACAAAVAVRETCGVDARLKWPNDLVVGDRKLAGLLAEARGDAVVVGMGLNVAWGRFPSHLEATATSLDRLSGETVDRSALLVHWLRAFEPRLAALAGSGGPGQVHAEAAARSATLGRVVRVELPGRTLEGRAIALTDEGYLEVAREDGHLEVVTAGDVIHLRPA
jgi:BirA family biotin operon repressor/biotin-[acetyl-CoA-carboxylase] ligase